MNYLDTMIVVSVLLLRSDVAGNLNVSPEPLSTRETAESPLELPIDLEPDETLRRLRLADLTRPL